MKSEMPVEGGRKSYGPPGVVLAVDYVGALYGGLGETCSECEIMPGSCSRPWEHWVLSLHGVVCVSSAVRSGDNSLPFQSYCM